MRKKLLFLLAVLFQYALIAGPKSGDVYREYFYIPDDKLVVSINENKFVFPDHIDLQYAIKAELVLEQGIQHLGYADYILRINEGKPQKLQLPVLNNKSESPALFFQQWYPVIELPLNLLKTDQNTVYLQAEDHLYNGKVHPGHKPWAPLYSAVLRVYYDSSKKQHTEGRIVSPLQSEIIKSDISVSIKTQHPDNLKQIDIIGLYEDVNYAGDGIYRQWQYILEKGKITHHIGSASSESEPIIWNISWLPEQNEDIQLVARITDKQGIIFMSPVTTGIQVKRAYTVELCKPYDVPEGFTTCQYGAFVYNGQRTEKFKITGYKEDIIDACFAAHIWNAWEHHGFMINNQSLQQLDITGYAGQHHWFIQHIFPLSVLKNGENTFSTIPAIRRGPDIFWPGVCVLVKYAAHNNLAEDLLKEAGEYLKKNPIIENSIGMHLIPVLHGSFITGTPTSFKFNLRFEEFQHQVTLTKNYYLGQTEVSQAQYKNIMGYNPSVFLGDSLPVQNVSWFEALEFCKKLSKKENKTYRLPTEAEWEYACRAGSSALYYTGDTISTSFANYDGRQTLAEESSGTFMGTPVACGSYPPNQWGLYNMPGNVFEWCSDWYAKYPEEISVDPQGASEDKRLEPARVLRGGAYDSEKRYCHNGFRYRLLPADKYSFTGFRVLMEK
jgi:formylglycine-generating enzyme required for sulfatase activity